MCFLKQGAPWSWKVMEFRKTIFEAWKVMENSKGHGKVMENDDYVMEFLLLQSDKTSFIKSNYEP